MKKLILLILLVFLVGCVNQTKINQTPKLVTDETTITTSKDQEKPDQIEKSLREEDILRERYGLFDFSTLTKENCKQKTDEFEARIVKERENVKDTEETLQEKRDQYERKKEIYESLQNSNDDEAITDAKDEVDKASKAVDDIENQVLEAQKFIKRLEFTLNEIKRECKILGAY